MFRRFQTNRGFTLVELIVVLAIIAILTAVLIPVVGNYTARAAETAVLNDATEAKNMIHTACADAATKGEITGDSAGGSVVVLMNTGGTVSVTVDGVTKADGSTDDYKLVTILKAMLPGLKENCKIKANVTDNAVLSYVYTDGKLVIKNGEKVDTSYDTTAL